MLKKRQFKSFICMFITFLMVFTSVDTGILGMKQVFAETVKEDSRSLHNEDVKKQVEDAIKRACKVVVDTHNSGDWIAIGLARAGNVHMISKDYLGKTSEYLKDPENKNTFKNKPTEFERITLGVLAGGGDPTNIGGLNLIKEIYTGDLGSQGINALDFGLIALDAGEYYVPSDARWTREKIIEAILGWECHNKENSYGKPAGWSWGSRKNADPDMTGMTITALAPYNNDKYPKVQEAIKRAVDWLKFAQKEDGGYHSWGTINSESCAQVIMGLCVNGIDPAGEEFTKTFVDSEPGKTKTMSVVDALLSFEVEGGGFAHIKDGNGAGLNGMATEQALYALDQYIYFAEKKGSIYQWGKQETKGNKTVNIRIEDKDNVIVPDTDVIVEGDNPTVKDVVKQVLESKGITFTENSTGFSMINNEISNESNNEKWLCSIEDGLIIKDMSSRYVNNYENIVVYLGKDSKDFTYTWIENCKASLFKPHELEEFVGLDVELIAKGCNNDGKQINISDAEVYVNGEKYKKDNNILLTDESGEFILNFDKPGNYEITIKKDDIRTSNFLVKAVKDTEPPTAHISWQVKDEIDEDIISFFWVRPDDNKDSGGDIDVIAKLNGSKLEPTQIRPWDGGHKYEDVAFEKYNNLLEVIVTDTTGNTQTITKHVINTNKPVEKDTEAPVIKVEGLKDGQEVSEKELSFKLIVTDNVDNNVQPTVKLNNEVVTGTNGEYKVTLIDGENIITIAATDKAGNKADIVYKIIYNKIEENELMNKVNETIESVSKKIIDSGYKWGSALPLVRAGKGDSVSKDYLNAIANYLDEVYDTSKEDFKTYSQTVIELLALGENPKNFADTNIVERIYNAYEGQSLENMALMLIAVDSGKYKEPENIRWSREKLINDIIKSLRTSKKSNKEVDTDDLGLVLVALAPYTKENSEAKNTVDNIVKYLSDIQKSDGSFATWNQVNARTCAEVIIGLCANGIDPISKEFTKGDKNVIDALLSFRAKDGGFAHVKENISVKSGELDTSEGLLALIQYKYFVEKKGSIYDWGEKNSDSEASKSLRVRRVELGSTSITIKLEEEMQLEVKVIPKDATNKKLTWKSNDDNIATVDQNGLVKGVNEGNTEIIVTSEDGQKTAKCSIEVIKEIEKDKLREEVEEAIANAGDVAQSNYNSMDWVVIGLARGKQAWKIDNGTYYENLENYLKENKGAFNKPTEYERMTLGILATGGDPTDIAGYNLIEKIYNADLNNQGINAYVYALIALDAGEYRIPESAKWNREKIIDAILKLECSNEANEYCKKAGWAYGSNKDADPDMTAMAMTALAPYNNDKYPKVQEAIKRAVDWLKFVQKEDGGYNSWGSINSESCAQVIMGLCTNGIDPAGEQFTTKNGGNVVKALLSFKTEEGGFAHIKFNDELKTNGMSTEQALYALDQYIYFLDGKGSIYHWGDMNPEEPEKPEDPVVDPEEPEKFVAKRIGKGSLKKGSSAEVEFKVENKLEKDEEVTLAVVLYDKKTNEMINYSYVKKTLKTGEESFAGGFIIPEKGDYVVKAIICDSLDKKEGKMNILVDPVEIAVE